MASTSARRWCAPIRSRRVCRDEVFGPFVTVTTFDTDDEALARSPTGSSTGSAAASGRMTCASPPLARRDTGRDGLDQQLQAGQSRVRRSAAPGRPGTGARWASRPSASTPSQSPCGSTSTRRSRRSTAARGRRHGDRRSTVLPFVYDALPGRVVFGERRVRPRRGRARSARAARVLLIADRSGHAWADRLVDTLGSAHRRADRRRPRRTSRSRTPRPRAR